MNGAFEAIFDAMPSPDGTKVYITGVDSFGTIGAFWTPIGNGIQSVTQASAGSLLVAPLGVAVSSDGKTLFVADPGAVDPAGGDDGVIWSIALPNAMPAVVGGSSGIYARGLTVAQIGSTDTLVFTGVNSTGQAGVFTLSAGGGTAMTIVAGAPFVDPSGVAVDSNGDYFVVDVTAGGSHRADVIKVSGTTPSVVLSDLFVGYPAGIAASETNGSIVLSGLASASGPDTLNVVQLGWPVDTTRVDRSLDAPQRRRSPPRGQRQRLCVRRQRR